MSEKPQRLHFYTTRAIVDSVLFGHNATSECGEVSKTFTREELDAPRVGKPCRKCFDAAGKLPEYTVANSKSWVELLERVYRESRTPRFTFTVGEVSTWSFPPAA